MDTKKKKEKKNVVAQVKIFLVTRVSENKSIFSFFGLNAICCKIQVFFNILGCA